LKKGLYTSLSNKIGIDLSCFFR